MRAGAQVAPHLTDSGHDQVRRRDLADAHRDVDALLQQIRDPIHQVQSDRHFRVASHESIQHRRHMQAPEQHRRGDGQVAAGFTFLVAEHVLDVADFPGHGAADVGVEPPLLSNPHLARGALE